MCVVVTVLRLLLVRRKIEFDVKIELVSGGHFMGSLEVSFMRKHYVTLSFELRLKSIKDMVLDLVDLIFPGISGRDRREVKKRMKRAFPDFSRRHYFPQTYRPASYFSDEDTMLPKRATKTDVGPDVQNPTTSGVKYRRTSDEKAPTSYEADGDRDVYGLTEKTALLLSAANKSEHVYDAIVSQIDFVDSEEDKGPDPAMVVAEADDLVQRANYSKDYVPREETEEDKENHLPD